MSHAQLLATEPFACNRSAPDAALPPVDSPAAFGLRVSRHFAQCRREGRQLALLWIEVDVQTSRAALSADERDNLMLMVNLRLRNRVRGTDEVSRLGEQGFAVLLASAGPVEADIVGVRLLQTLRGAYGLEERQMLVSVRLGKSSFPECGRNGAELAEAARQDLNQPR